MDKIEAPRIRSIIASSRRSHHGEQEPSRRRFIKAGAAFACSFAAAARDLPNAFIARSSATASEDLVERVKPQINRVDSLKHLLTPKGKIVGVPGGGLINPSAEEQAKWDAWKRIGFPHDRAALDAYAVFARNVEVVEGDQLIDIPNEASIVTTGSPASNLISQRYIPYRDENGEDRIISRTFDSLPYRYEFLREKRLRRVPSAPGGLALAPHKGLGAKGATFLADTSGDGALLKKDFLLISRLPRGLGLAADIINAGGGYGPGTEALRLLFDRNAFPDEELRELERLLGNAQFFQVAFLCDIADDGGPCNLRIWDKCPPVRIRPEDLRASSTLATSEDDDQDGDSHLLPTWSSPEK
jgi:hypothetical protein